MTDEIFGEAEINRALKELPDKIEKQANRTNRYRVKYELARAKLSKERAVAYLRNEGTIAEREAMVDQDELVNKAIMEEITAKGNYEAQKIRLEQLENKFVAVRKAAGLIEIQYKAQ